MHPQATNSSTQTCDVFRFGFGSAGALELVNEYSGHAVAPAPILASQSSSMHVPLQELAAREARDELSCRL